ncbi:hypothetical protein ABK040_008973 [Willaertia magna]
METQVIPNYWSICFPTQPIKFIKYDESSIVICTKNNEIYKSTSDYSQEVKFTEIKKSESTINNIKFMDYKDNYLIIVTELNEFYFQYVDDEYYFTKFNISFKENIKQFSILNGSLFILTKKFSLFTFKQFYSYFTDKNLEFTKIEKKLLIKEMSSSGTHLILLDLFGNIYMWGCNEYNELGLENHIGESFVPDFTKVELLFKVKQIFADNYISFIFHISFSKSTFISDDANNIYMSGGSDFDYDYGIVLEKGNFLKEFARIEKFNTKYLTILPLEDFTLFIGTDYKINNECDEEDNILGEKCFKVLQNEQLIDLCIYCNDEINNIKKRKRNELY